MPSPAQAARYEQPENGRKLSGNVDAVDDLGASHRLIAVGDLVDTLGRTAGLSIRLYVGMLIIAVLLPGLLMREKQGPGKIGMESVLILSIYGGAVVLQATLF